MSVQLLRAGSEVLRDVVFVESSKTTGNSLLPTEEFADAQALTTLEELKQRRWRLLGHVLQMNKTRHTGTAWSCLRWLPSVKSKHGIPMGS